MNNDLISRSALLEKVHLVAGEGSSGRVYVSDINAAPAVDAEPVRHGQWIGDDTVYCGAGKRWYKCTSCNERVFTAVKGSKGYRFCPNCGAKMDGKDGAE